MRPSKSLVSAALFATLSGLAHQASADPRPSDIGFVDSATGRMRCHYMRAEDQALCDSVVLWAEEAYAAQVEKIGFRAPLPDGGLGGTDALDLYLTTDAGGAGIAWVDCDSDAKGCVDLDPNDGFAGASAFVVLDPRTDLASFPHFVHHEFNHVLQYATDFDELSLCVWEGTAVAAERWTDPSWSTSVSDLADYQATPWASAVLQDGYFLDDEFGLWSYYEYGCVAWVFWMDETYGDGEGSIGPILWESLAQEGAGDEPDILDGWATLTGSYQLSMLEFAAARARMGTASGPSWAAFAGEEAYAMRDATGLSLPAEVDPQMPLYPLGTSYVDIEVKSGDRVLATIDADTDVSWGVVAVDALGQSTTLGTSLDRVSEADGTMTIGVVNLGAPDLDGDDVLMSASFHLSLTLDGPVTPDEPEPDDTSSAGSGTSAPPSSSEPSGCGLGPSGGQTALFGWALLALSLAARRRQLGRDSQ